MNGVLIVMAILGCGDGKADCRMVRTVDTGFSSMAACKAAAPLVLGRLTDLDYPVIVAQCREQAPPKVAQAKPDSR